MKVFRVRKKKKNRAFTERNSYLKQREDDRRKNNYLEFKKAVESYNDRLYRKELILFLEGYDKSITLKAFTFRVDLVNEEAYNLIRIQTLFKHGHIIESFFQCHLLSIVGYGLMKGED